MMSYDLHPVLEAIQAGDKIRARQLLRPMLKNPTAEVLFLAARVTDSRERIIDLLEQALKLDPAHERAAKVLSALAPEKSATTASPGERATPRAAATSAPEETPPSEVSPFEPTQHSAPTEVLNKTSSSPFKPQLPAIPEVMKAHAYAPSGRYSRISLVVVVLIGLGLGSVSGAAVYFGGKLLIGPLAGGILGIVGAIFGDVGGSSQATRRGLALVTLVGLVILGLIGLVYLITVGWLFGALLWEVVKAGRIRHAGRAFAATLASAMTGYGCFVILVLHNNGMLHTTSGVFRVLFDLDYTPWWLYLVVIIEAAIWVAIVTHPTTAGIARLPYAEDHGRWYDRKARTVTIKETAAPLLMTILESQTPERLQSIIPVAPDHYPRLELRLRRCSADHTADYHLAAVIHWKDIQESKPDKAGKTRITTQARQEDWFNAMIPASLGTALEAALFVPPPPPQP